MESALAESVIKKLKTAIENNNSAKKETCQELMIENPLIFLQIESFYSLPNEIIRSVLENIKPIDVAQFSDQYKFVHELIERITKHLKQDAIFLLPRLGIKNCNFTHQQCMELLSLFSGIDLFDEIIRSSPENELTKPNEEKVEKFVNQEKIQEKPKKEIEKPDPFENNIFKAATNGDLQSIKYLIEVLGIDKNVKNQETECTPLHMAIFGNHMDIIKYLIEEQNADPEAKTHEGQTPLFFACQYGNLDAVKYLIDQRNVNIESTDPDGERPLMCAARCGHTEIVKYLISKGADKSARNFTGRDAASFAMRNPDILALLR